MLFKNKVINNCLKNFFVLIPNTVNIGIIHINRRFLEPLIILKNVKTSLDQ